MLLELECRVNTGMLEEAFNAHGSSEVRADDERRATLVHRLVDIYIVVR